MLYQFSKDESFDIPINELGSTYCDPFLLFWKNLQGEHFAPSWDQFHLDELPPSIIPYCSVRDVIWQDGKVVDFHHRFYGSAHIGNKGYDLTGTLVTEHPSGSKHAKLLFEENLYVVNSKAPKAASILMDPKDNNLPLYRVSLRVPLSSDHIIVDKVATLTAWSRESKKLNTDLLD